MVSLSLFCPIQNQLCACDIHLCNYLAIVKIIVLIKYQFFLNTNRFPVQGKNKVWSVPDKDLVSSAKTTMWQQQDDKCLILLQRNYFKPMRSLLVHCDWCALCSAHCAPVICMPNFKSWTLSSSATFISSHWSQRGVVPANCALSMDIIQIRALEVNPIS